MSIPAEFSEIPQRELRNEVSRVLREVKGGQSYTITVDGSPVADLIPHRYARRRVAVPRDEILAAFRGLSDSAVSGDSAGEQYFDDSLYDPYERAYRRGAFADKGGE